MKTIILIFLSVIFTLPVLADEIANIFDNATNVNASNNCSNSTSSPLSYLNCIRQLAGLIPFNHNKTLQKAAANHAQYLNANNKKGHDELAGYYAYTGHTPNQRGAYVGFKTAIAENVSTHSQGDYVDSIDGLMSAIYHRFAFLSVNLDLIGIADNNDLAVNPHAFVYKMANSHINALCNKQSFNGYGKYWLACINTQGEPNNAFKVEGGQFKLATEHNAKQNAQLIIWPSENSTHIPPVFYEESPDPLPNYSVSGYPISVEFNSIYYPKAPKIIRFTVTRVKDKKDIEAITVMHSRNDPNEKFTKHQHAFFPLQRLDWATEYEVYIAYADNGIKRKTWRFTTKDLAIKTYTIRRSLQINTITPNEPFALYFPPSNGQESAGVFNSTYDTRLTLNIDIIDSNTLKVRVSGKGKTKITFNNKTVEFSL